MLTLSFGGGAVPLSELARFIAAAQRECELEKERERERERRRTEKHRKEAGHAASAAAGGRAYYRAAFAAAMGTSGSAGDPTNGMCLLSATVTVSGFCPPFETRVW